MPSSSSSSHLVLVLWLSVIFPSFFFQTNARNCLSWGFGEKAPGGQRDLQISVSGDDSIAMEKTVCALYESSESAAGSCTEEEEEGECSLAAQKPIDVGLVVTADGNSYECFNGETSEPLSTVARVDLGCNTRWRFLTYDVWPIGSVIIAGSTAEGYNFGVCRCPVEDKNYEIGRLYLAGPKMGGCGCKQGSGKEEKVLIGEYEYLQADEGKGHLFQDVASNSNAEVAMSDKDLYPALQKLIADHLSEEDRSTLERITDTQVSVLEEELMKQDPSFLRKIFSHERYIPHPTLNNKGLHLLRCLLAEKIADSRRRQRGYHKHPDYETFMRDGILAKNFSELSSEDIQGIMAMVSGFDINELPPIRWVDRPVKHLAGDAQYQMHVDTFHAAYKIWIYMNETTVDQGPLNFVRGSHRNTPGKLEWLYRMTVPPATHVLKEPSIRLDVDETELGFEPRSVMTTSAKTTFVIADTSGFHARGMAEPGTIRHAMRIEGPYDGGLPRKNPFFE